MGLCRFFKDFPRDVFCAKYILWETDSIPSDNVWGISRARGTYYGMGYMLHGVGYEVVTIPLYPM